MPVQMSKSQLINKMKNRSKGGWQKAREVEPKAYTGGGLPANIKNGVAVCKSYKLGQTDKGDPYFVLVGIVKEPEDIEGQRASIFWFMNESEFRTYEECEAQLANDLRLLNGGDEAPEDYDDILEFLKDKCEQGVHFLFNTGRPGKNNGMVKAYIQGLADGWADDPQEGAGEEEERPQRGKAGASASTNGDAKAAAPEDNPADDQQQEQLAEGEGEEAGSEEAAYIPQKGDKYNYKAPKAKEAELYVVTACNEEKETVDLKQVKPVKGKPALAWKKVPFSKLEAE